MNEEDKKKIEEYKKAYDNATTDEERAKAHAGAESVRAGYGYSGGADGSESISLAKPKYNFGTSTDYGTYEDDLSRYSEAQKQYQIQQLKQARDTALQNLKTQEQEIKPTYENARNQTSATSQQNARTFNEYLANRGLTNSGASAQGEMNRLSALQNDLGTLNTQEANAYRDIANQRTQINNDYANGVATANTQAQAQYLQDLMNYNEQQRQYAQQLQNQANYQYANDYQSRINELLAQGYDPNSLEILQLQALRGEKAYNQYTTGQQNALANIQAGNINYNNASALGMTVEQAQKYYENYQAQLRAQAEKEAEQEAFERDYKKQQLENETQKTRATIANIQSLINERTANRNASSNNTTSNNTASSSTLNLYKNLIDNNYVTTDILGETTTDKSGIMNYLANSDLDVTSRKILAGGYGITNEDVINYVQNSGLPDSTAIRIMNDFGINTDV